MNLINITINSSNAIKEEHKIIENGKEITITVKDIRYEQYGLLPHRYYAKLTSELHHKHGGDKLNSFYAYVMDITQFTYAAINNVVNNHMKTEVIPTYEDADKCFELFKEYYFLNLENYIKKTKGQS